MACVRRRRLSHTDRPERRAFQHVERTDVRVIASGAPQASQPAVGDLRDAYLQPRGGNSPAIAINLVSEQSRKSKQFVTIDPKVTVDWSQ